MKRFFLLLLGIVAVLSAAAQTSLLATLSHEGTIKSYYGANAFNEANSEAEDGDVITLSSGTFYSTNITKAITVRGSGFDATTSHEPTYITGDLSILVIDGLVVMEGIYTNNNVNVNNNSNVQFIKCRLYSISGSRTNSYSYAKISLINCRVARSIQTVQKSDVTCVNSVINNPTQSNSTSNNIIYNFTNCFVSWSRDALNSSTFYNSILTNCFVYAEGSKLHSSNIAINCVAFNEDTFSNLTPGNNIVAPDTDIFKSFSASCEDGATYELTDATVNSYIGNDGTQIGIYGGMLPYNSIPNIPQITKFQVADRTTADGKLSIDISVEMPQ